MTTEQLWLFNGLYLTLLVVVAILTRATARRVIGALAGGLAVGVAAIGIVVLGERARWWHQLITRQPYFLTLWIIDFALCAFVFLITWRIARRFGYRGLAVVVTVGAVRSATGLLVYDTIPGMGHLQVGRPDHPGRLRELRSLGDRRARRDAVGRWAGSGGPIGPLAMEGRPTPRRGRPLRNVAALRFD